MMVGRIFGEAGLKVVIEEYLEGEELTVMALTDGLTILPMLSSQDHKKIFDGDSGPNTGGMGAYSPTRQVDELMMQTINDQILYPAIRGLENEGRRYKGILYAGLMITSVGPKVIEFNCRMGDPETQAVLPLLKSDLADLFIAIADGNLRIMEPQWIDGAAVCVVLSSRGYPDKAETGCKIDGLSTLSDDNICVFHAGTKRENGNWITAGGRVLGVTAVKSDLRSALDSAYEAVEQIYFDGMHYRKDIGHLAFRKRGA
jgi:phosphoribosylamine--glycine ligase